jgi:hypothetical protein
MLTSACISCTASAISFGAFLDEPNGPIPIMSLLASYLLASELSLCVQADALQREIAIAHDFDARPALLQPASDAFTRCTVDEPLLVIFAVLRTD